MLAELACQFVHALDARIDLLDLVEQFLRLGRGVKPPPDAFEQRKPDTGLRVRQQPTHRRLRHKKQLRGPADGARDHDGPKDLDLPQIE
ncbi:hypothetical protein D3C87_1804460 [compost metagenome]